MNRLTKLSEITGLPMPIELIESCGESACRDICDDYVENGCIDCPVQKCMSKLNEYQDTGLEPEQIRSFLKDFGVSVVMSNTKLRNELKEYKDLEEQGLLIKLPCKLGTKLFIIQTELWADGKSTRREKRIIESEFTDWNILHVVDNWGKTVFLTREEAEKALEDKANE